jgi:hypothetical protein
MSQLEAWREALKVLVAMKRRIKELEALQGHTIEEEWSFGCLQGDK